MARKVSKPGRKKPRRSTRDTSSDTVTEDLSRSIFSVSNKYVEDALRADEDPGLLEDYFGTNQYAELRQLAQDSAARSVQGGPRVLILPGIMGSKLGRGANSQKFEDVLWADPFDIVRGRLSNLALKRGSPRIEPLGVILIAYLALKWRLRRAGYNAEFHPFDWRRSLPTLGKALAQKIDKSPKDTPVHLVAHSMGGLAARAALSHKPKNLRRVVMLGTPNHGSFSPIQAFRGAHSIVRKVAFLDLHHSAEDLARDVFGTFPGLCEMLPSPDMFNTDYFRHESWPDGGVKPDARLLKKSHGVQKGLPAEFGGKCPVVIIAGVNRDTVIDAQIEDDEFVYAMSREGDGTVPLSSARLDCAARTYFIEEDHGAMPNNRLIAQALETILATGETNLLPDVYQPPRGAAEWRVSERDLQVPPYDAAERKDGAVQRSLSLREQRHLLEEFAAPDRSMPMGAAGPSTATGTRQPGLSFSDQIVVSRRRQRRLDITLGFGSITEVDADAYVLGMFRNVALGGAAAALDRLADGAIEQMLSRRMFNANVGEVSILPTGRHPIRADVIAFAGLGPFDRFDNESLTVTAENLIRTFVATRVDDFATVPVGGSIGTFTFASLESLFKGFIDGLRDADHDHQFRSITICEIDEDRFSALRAALYRLSAMPLFNGIEVTLRERTLPEPFVPAPRRAVAERLPASVYLIVREEVGRRENRTGHGDRMDEGVLDFGVSVLTAGEKAAIYKAQHQVEKAELDELLDRIEDPGFSFNVLTKLGEDLAKAVLPDNIVTILGRYTDRPLVVVHDAAASKIPWETLRIAGKSPAIDAGLSHRYEAENLAITKWLSERQLDPILDVLLITDPTEDLVGAAREGRRVKALFGTLGPGIQVTELYQEAARKSDILRHFSSGKFDVVHYAGHAYFDPDNPAKSGILCAGRDVLSGADLAKIGNLPSLVFFNACEAARVRGGRAQGDPESPIGQRTQTTVGFAEAFLRGGVANYLGTYWPVGDAAAEEFSGTFYMELLSGSSLHKALIKGRQKVHRLQSVDWADYVLYGDPEFVLKLPQSRKANQGRPATLGVAGRRDLTPVTAVVCSGPPGAPVGLPVDVDDGDYTLETGHVDWIDPGFHEFKLKFQSDTFEEDELCQGGTSQNPQEIRILKKV